MQIEIIKNRYGSLFAFLNGYELFQFEWRSKTMGGPAWYFWPRGNYDPQIFRVKKKDFPMDYFVSMCRVKAYTFNLSNGNLNEEVTIVKGENLIKGR